MQNSFIADGTLIEALEQRSVSMPCSKGRILFMQGEAPIGLYLLQTGKASLIMKAEKDKEVLHLSVGSGSILGLPAIVGNVPYTLSAMAHQGSEVNFLAHKDFEELIQAQPSLYPKVLEVLAAEVRSARLALTGLMGKLGSRPSRVSA
jgi:CRP-like cAMP-binding protein